MTGDSIETVEVARRLLRSASTASLATLDADGAPFATLVTMATDHDGAPLALLSRLAVHTANIHRDARASLLVAPTAGDDDALAGARLTLSGRFVRLDESRSKPGTGLGLALAVAVMELHGGRVEFSATEPGRETNRGLTVRMVFPDPKPV